MGFFSDIPDTVRVRWYFCDQTAPVLPFPTVFNSKTLSPDPNLQYDLGEVGTRSWVDGSPPPWSARPDSLGWPIPPDFGPIFIKLVSVVNPDLPPFGRLGALYECIYDPVQDQWIGPRIPFPHPSPMYLQIVIDYTIWRVFWFDGVNLRASVTRLIYPPYALFPAVAPLGDPDTWINGGPFGSGVGADPEGFCVPAGNIAGIAGSLPIYTSGVGGLIGREVWTGQATYSDPGARRFQSFVIFDSAGAYTWVAPDAAIVARVNIQAAGGSGGFVANNNFLGGAGGGSGAWGVFDHVRIQSGVSYGIEVGAGGAPVSGFAIGGAGLRGNPGLPTNFGGLATAGPGDGGEGGTRTGNYAAGGAGGVVVGEPLWSSPGYPGTVGAIGPTAGDGGHSHFALGGLGSPPGGGSGGVPGSGGAGTFDALVPSGAGGAGQVILIYGFS
jgi:hypothetical protein